MDKEINELTQLTQLSSEDLSPVSDSSSPPPGSYRERLKNERVEKLLITQSRWDGGVEPNRISCTGTSTAISFIDAGVEGVIARVTALDIIRAVQGGDGTQVIYGISKDGGSWSEHSNPEEAYVDYGCGEDGGRPIFIRVKDDTFQSPAIEFFIFIQDPSALCGGP
jgi:hypothetical protein